MSPFAFVVIVFNVFRSVGSVARGPKQIVNDFFLSMGTAPYNFLQDLQKRSASIEGTIRNQCRGLWKNKQGLFDAVRSPSDILEAQEVGRAYGMVFACAILSCSTNAPWEYKQLRMLLALAYFHDESENSDLDAELANFMSEEHKESIQFCQSIVAELRVQIVHAFIP